MRGSIEVAQNLRDRPSIEDAMRRTRKRRRSTTTTAEEAEKLAKSSRTQDFRSLLVASP